MTTEQKLQWVAVPGGVLPDGRLRVTAVMSPRLRTDEGDHLGGVPRSARLARDRGGRDLDGRRGRRRSADRGGEPGTGVRRCGRRCSRRRPR